MQVMPIFIVDFYSWDDDNALNSPFYYCLLIQIFLVQYSLHFEEDIQGKWDRMLKKFPFISSVYKENPR